MKRWPLLIAVLLAVLVIVTSATAARPAGPVQDRVIRDGRISESSGLAASIDHPGVLWTHNDSGHPPVIYAVGADGRTKAAVTLTGEYNRDWEAMTSFRWPARGGRAMLAVGDIGDNSARHPSIRIAILPEPSLRTQKITPVRVFRLMYPDGARNAEALLADPRTGRLYVVSKALFTSQIYAVPQAVWPGRRTGFTEGQQLEAVASTGADLITDGVFVPSGRMLLRGYDQLFVLPPPEQASDGRLSPLASVGLPDQEQGESLTTDDGGQTVLIGSEGDRQPVLRLSRGDLGDVGNELGKDEPSAGVAPSDPASGTTTGDDALAGSGGSGTASDGTASDGAAGSSGSSVDSGGGIRGLGWLVVLAGVGVTGVVLVLGLSMFLRGR